MLLDAVLHFTLQLTITNYTNLLHQTSQFSTRTTFPDFSCSLTCFVMVAVN